MCPELALTVCFTVGPVSPNSSAEMRWYLLFLLLVLLHLHGVEHEAVVYQHNTDVVTNYGHGETHGRILGSYSQLAYECALVP